MPSSQGATMPQNSVQIKEIKAKSNLAHYFQQFPKKKLPHKTNNNAACLQRLNRAPILREKLVTI